MTKQLKISGNHWQGNKIYVLQYERADCFSAEDEEIKMVERFTFLCVQLSRYSDTTDIRWTQTRSGGWRKITYLIPLILTISLLSLFIHIRVTESWRQFQLNRGWRQVTQDVLPRETDRHTHFWVFLSAVERLLTYCGTVWFSSCTVENSKDLQQVARTGELIENRQKLLFCCWIACCSAETFSRCVESVSDSSVQICGLFCLFDFCCCFMESLCGLKIKSYM